MNDGLIVVSGPSGSCTITADPQYALAIFACVKFAIEYGPETEPDRREEMRDRFAVFMAAALRDIEDATETVYDAAIGYLRTHRERIRREGNDNVMDYIERNGL